MLFLKNIKQSKIYIISLCSFEIYKSNKNSSVPVLVKFASFKLY